MSIKLPPRIDAFMQAKSSGDSQAFVACFAEAAVVYTEEQEFRGREAIRQWFENSAKYKNQYLVMGFSAKRQEAILSAQVSGDFAGSPVLLDYFFTTQAGLITSLRIVAREDL